MIFKVLTLFPEMIESVMGTGIIGRAVKERALKLETFNIRDFADNKRAQVDDYPYGGGAGQVIQAEPVFRAYNAAVPDIKDGAKRRVIYLSPQGKRFDQRMAKEFSRDDELVFLCGHYEGVDERVLEEIVTDYVSAGDYILTGGELPALIIMDAVSRLLPGVLGNDESPEVETFYRDLLEYPQYSRPESWHDKNVPEVLLNGNHADIESWRLERSIERTAAARPDLLRRYEDKTAAVADIKKAGICGIPASQALLFHDTDILFKTDQVILIKDHDESEYILCPLDKRVNSLDDDTCREIAEVIFEDSVDSCRLVSLGFDPYTDMNPIRQTMIAFTEKNPLSSARVREYGDFGKELREKITKAHDADRIFFEYLDEDDPRIEDALKIGLYKADVYISFFIKMQ